MQEGCEAGLWITADFIEIFGSRPGRFGHAEPILDADDWASVNQAAGKLETVFAESPRR